MTDRIDPPGPGFGDPDALSRAGRRPWLGKLVAVIVSLAILGAIYWRIDLDALWGGVANASLFWIVIAILALVPALALTAWRLCIIARPHGRLSFGEGSKLILIAHALNMILPSRLGDFAKAHAMTVPGTVPGRAALSVVVIEKTWDALVVMLWCAVGVLTVDRADFDVRGAAIAVVAVTTFGMAVVTSRRFARAVFLVLRLASPDRFVAAIAGMEEVWTGALAAFWRDRKRAALVVALTVAIWFIHLVEIWLFILAVGVNVPFLAHLGIAPLVMMASLVPVTLSGIGTRDAAIVLLYGPYMAAPTAAAVGLLVILRYLAPALVGLPFTSRYLGGLRLPRSG